MLAKKLDWVQAEDTISQMRLTTTMINKACGARRKRPRALDSCFGLISPHQQSIYTIPLSMSGMQKCSKQAATEMKYTYAHERVKQPPLVAGSAVPGCVLVCGSAVVVLVIIRKCHRCRKSRSGSITGFPVGL